MNHGVPISLWINSPLLLLINVYANYRFMKSRHHQKFPSLRGGRRSLTGWIIFIFYKRVISVGLNETPPHFFAFPVGELGWG